MVNTSPGKVTEHLLVSQLWHSDSKFSQVHFEKSPKRQVAPKLEKRKIEDTCDFSITHASITALLILRQV